MHPFPIDLYAYHNRLRTTHPAEKILFAGLTILICLVASSPVVALLALAFVTVAVVGVAGIPLRAFWYFVRLPASFIVLGVLTLAVMSVDPADAGTLFALPVGPWHLGATWSGLERAAQVASVSFACVASMLSLALTTPMVDITDQLRKWRVPQLFIELMVLMYRFIFVFIETAQAMYIAQKRPPRLQQLAALAALGGNARRQPLPALAGPRGGLVHRADRSRLYRRAARAHGTAHVVAAQLARHRRRRERVALGGHRYLVVENSMSGVHDVGTSPLGTALPGGPQHTEEPLAERRNGANPAATTIDAPPVLAAEGVTFTYPDGTVALRDLSLALPKGRRIALLGANGCGKTTLFLHFNGILQPTAGTIALSGEPIGYDRHALRELRRRVGLVFQDPDSQLFAANVRQDISFGPLNLDWSEEQVRDKVEQVISDTDLTDLADRPTHLLSYGQKKRVAIAGVLVMEPEVIIADEPTAGLDPEMTTRVLDLLDTLHRTGRTIVISTHDVELALAWADHVIVLRQGRLLAEGRPDVVLADEPLLREARLLLPIVVNAYRQLRAKGLLPPSAAVPRTAADLAALLVQHTTPRVADTDHAI